MNLWTCFSNDEDVCVARRSTKIDAKELYLAHEIAFGPSLNSFEGSDLLKTFRKLSGSLSFSKMKANAQTFDQSTGSEKVLMDCENGLKRKRGVLVL